MHVMILEEDPVLRTHIASALAEVGCDVLALGRLDAAKEAARRLPVDVLVLGESVEGRLAHDLALLAEWRNPGLGAILLSDCEGERTDEIFDLIPSLQAIVGRRTAPTMLASLVLDAARSRAGEPEAASGRTPNLGGVVPEVRSVEAQAGPVLDETEPLARQAEMILPLATVVELWDLPPAAATILAQDSRPSTEANPSRPAPDMTPSAQTCPTVALIRTEPMPRALTAWAEQTPTHPARPSPAPFYDVPHAQAAGTEALISATTAGPVSPTAPFRPEVSDADLRVLSAASGISEMAPAAPVRPVEGHTIPSFLRRRPTGIEEAAADLPGGPAQERTPSDSSAASIADHERASMVPDRPAAHPMSFSDSIKNVPARLVMVTALTGPSAPEALVPPLRPDAPSDLPTGNLPVGMATEPLPSPVARPEPVVAPSAAIPAQGPVRSALTTRDTLQLLRTLAARAAAVMEAQGRPWPTDPSSTAATPRPAAPPAGAEASPAAEPPAPPPLAIANTSPTTTTPAPRDPRAELELRRAQLAAMGLHRGGRPAADPALSPRLAPSAAPRSEVPPAPVPAAKATSGWRRLHLA